MRDLSKIVLRGTVSDAPTMRTFEDGGKLVNFGVKTLTMESDESGAMRERPAWHRIVARGEKNADLAANLASDSPVYVEGRLRTRKYTRDGNDFYATEVSADIVRTPETADPQMNRSLILGNVGRDPEVRHFESKGFSVMNLTVATSETFTRRSGEQGEETEWHRVSAFNDLARRLEGKIEKGHRVLVEGRVHTRKYTDRNGVERRSTETEAHSIASSGGRGSGGSGYSRPADGGRGYGGGRGGSDRGLDRKLRERDEAGAGSSGVDTSDEDDQVPF